MPQSVDQCAELEQRAVLPWRQIERWRIDVDCREQAPTVCLGNSAELVQRLRADAAPGRTLSHFARGLVGESDRGDMRRIEAAIDQMRNLGP